MSGFTPDWLSLRESLDRCSRALPLIQRLYDLFAGAERISVCDLGAGTASLLRALAPFLPGQQEWLLVDGDPENLAAARPLLARWADRCVEKPAGGLSLEREGQRIAVSFRSQDLTADLSPAVEGADLVACSALFDLAAPAWLGGLARLLARRRQPLYASLTFTGALAADPPLPLDRAVAAAFAAHQRADKGLGGVAAGPAAQSLLAEALKAEGACVLEGDSSWQLSAEDPALLSAELDTLARAAGETGLLPEAALADWRARRRAETRRLEVAHADLLALWPAA